jgi:3D-(3,5/4)-trihydroxycyclohexane-1,2-dione acylhydrolase (decyclizing)
MSVTYEKHSSTTVRKTRRLTMSQALIQFLSAQQVEQFDGTYKPLLGGIFGIYGHGNVAGIGEALWDQKDTIPYYRGQNEQGMAHAAIAYAKSHRCRRIMAVTTSIGPGATNLVTAAAVAHTSRLPVLFLPGDIFASRRPDPVLQQLEDERNPLKTVNDCFEPVSRYFDRITRPEQLISSLPQAISTLLHPVTRGPVTLSLPQDVQTEVYEFPEWFFEEKKHAIFRQRPDTNQLENCAQLLREAKRPMIIVGGGCHYSDAEETLKHFAEKHHIPIGETQAGKGCLAWDHPMNLGGVGVTGTAAANAIAKEADLVLCVGTRLSDFPTASKSLFHREQTPLIGLNVSPFDASKSRAHELISDAKVGLKELSEALDDYQTADAYHQRIDNATQDWESQYQQITSFDQHKGKPVDAQVLAVVNNHCQDRDIVVGAAGGLPGELHRLWRPKDIVGYHLEYAYSCMGYEIAGGLGVKMAHPDREVYVMLGDGSYLMLHTELLTSIQLGYKINIILLDNRGFGCINRLQKSCGCSPYGNLFSQDGAPQVDFSANAASYGAHANKVSNLDELKCVLADNLKISRSCVTVIETDPQHGSPGTAWWDVAIPEVSEQHSVTEARQQYEQHLKGLGGSDEVK